MTQFGGVTPSCNMTAGIIHGSQSYNFSESLKTKWLNFKTQASTPEVIACSILSSCWKTCYLGNLPHLPGFSILHLNYFGPQNSFLTHIFFSFSYKHIKMDLIPVFIKTYQQLTIPKDIFITYFNNSNNGGGEWESENLGQSQSVTDNKITTCI